MVPSWTAGGDCCRAGTVDVPVFQEEATVAALRQGGGFRTKKRGGGGNRGQSRHNGGGGRMEESQAAREARMAAGLCLKHWRFGERAFYCEQPCSWTGNAAAGGNETPSPPASYFT